MLARQLCETLDGAEWIADLVRQSRGQEAQLREPLRLDLLNLEARGAPGTPDGVRTRLPAAPIRLELRSTGCGARESG